MIKVSVNKFEVPVKYWTFPAGERGVKIEPEYFNVNDPEWTISCIFQSNQDLIDILLIANAIRQKAKNPTIHLIMPYFPYARQDKISDEGESISLQVVCYILDTGRFASLTVWDPHSDVLAGMLYAGYLKVHPQHVIHADMLKLYGFDKNTDVLISPDNGASKKIYKTAKLLNANVVECSKVRDKSGNIVKCYIPDYGALEIYKTLWVCDDICDGGATFIELAKAIKEKYYRCEIRLNLLVTHGIFSKGTVELNKYYDNIYCANDMSEVK